MDLFRDLIKAIPWENLSEKSVIAVVSIILVIASLYFWLKYKEKKIKVDEAKIEAAQAIIGSNNMVKQKEIDKFDNKIDVDLEKNVQLEDATIGNVEGNGTANVKVTIQEGSKLKNSRIGNIDGR